MPEPGYLQAGWIEATTAKQYREAPTFITYVLRAGVAQLVEQLICNQQVGGSSPFASFLDVFDSRRILFFLAKRKRLLWVSR